VGRRHVARTLQADGSAEWNGSRILATHDVVPQCRCCDDGRDVRQTDNEVVRMVSYATSNQFRNSSTRFSKEKSLIKIVLCSHSY